MAKKRKRKRTYTPPAAKPEGASSASAAKAPEKAPAKVRGAPPQRRQHKEEARRARERAIKRYRRRAALRRVVTLVVVAAVVAGVFWFLTRVGTPDLSGEAVAAAEDAGCSPMERQDDLGGGHDQPYTYPTRPATSGRHDPSPLAAGVYDTPQPEEKLVHSMEHAYAVVYYANEGPDAATEEVVTALTEAATDEEKVILAPYAGLPQGTSVTFAAWNYLMTCPSSIEPGQATTIANAWIEAFRGENHAPEPGVA
jgi:hypothetical protein